MPSFNIYNHESARKILDAVIHNYAHNYHLIDSFIDLPIVRAHAKNRTMRMRTLESPGGARILLQSSVVSGSDARSLERQYLHRFLSSLVYMSSKSNCLQLYTALAPKYIPHDNTLLRPRSIFSSAGTSLVPAQNVYIGCGDETSCAAVATPPGALALLMQVRVRAFWVGHEFSSALERELVGSTFSNSHPPRCFPKYVSFVPILQY